MEWVSSTPVASTMWKDNDVSCICTSETRRKVNDELLVCLRFAASLAKCTSTLNLLAALSISSKSVKGGKSKGLKWPAIASGILVTLCSNFKLEKILPGIESSPGASEEWGSGWNGTNFIVEIEEATPTSPVDSEHINSREDISSIGTINTTTYTQGTKIIVRTEEVLIVGLVLMLWVGAIILFFNRWGKIRMLEPYQPKFQQQHRASCPLSDIDPIPHQRSSVSRTSMGFVNSINMPSCQFAATYNPTIHSKGYLSHSRPRQNSVFVGPSPNQFLMPKPPRKTRSAIDLHSMILDETAAEPV